MTELTHPLAAEPQAPAATKRAKRTRRRTTPTFTELVYAHFDWWQAAAAAVRERERGRSVPRRARALRAPARRGRARVLVLARRERRGADREEARDLVGDAAHRVPPRERLGDEERAGHRARAPSLRRAGAYARGSCSAASGSGSAFASSWRRPRTCSASSTPAQRTPTTTKIAAALEEERGALDKAEAYYCTAANGQAQIVYFVGMVFTAARHLARHGICLSAELGRCGVRRAHRRRGRRGRQRRAADQRRPVRPRVRRRPAVRVLPRRVTAAHRRRLRARDRLRVQERRPAPAAEQGPHDVGGAVRAHRARLHLRLQRAVREGHARGGGGDAACRTRAEPTK